MDHKIDHAEGQNESYTYYCTCGWKTEGGLSHRDAMRAWEEHAGVPSPRWWEK